MYEVESNTLFEQLFEHYKQKRQDEDGERPWLDANFYLQMDLWVAEEFGCIIYIKDRQLSNPATRVFEFSSQEDYVRLRMTI